jgi:hypothetical protein
MPEGFDTETYNRAFQLIWTLPQEHDDGFLIGNTWHALSGPFYESWYCIHTSIIECESSARRYTDSVKQVGLHPEAPEEVHVKAAALMSFFFFGKAAIESLFFASLMVAAIANTRIRIKAGTIKSAQPRSIVDTFEKRFNQTSLTQFLRDLCDSEEFLELKAFRDTLSHQGFPVGWFTQSHQVANK